MTHDLIENQRQRVVKLQGDVDLEHSPAIRRILLGAVAEMRDVLVDLSDVTYLDSSGIACLVEALQAARTNGTELGLVAVSVQALRVLQLARLDMIFKIHDDLAAALEAGA
ncbi:MAG: STAS domain-containing protein [Kiloniellaceae bacterium]